jgi:AcrR family transcriptional regulator
VIDAALRLAALHGWREVRLRDIAEEAGIGLADLYRLYPSKSAILNAFFRRIDAETLAASGPYGDEEGVRDRLFDIIMHRFDAMHPYRDAIRNIIRDARSNPMMALCGALPVARSLSWMLEAAGASRPDLIGLARIKGLGLVFASALRVWLDDETEDLSPTMAALDKSLHRAERFVTAMQGRRRRHPAPEPGAQAQPG